jgi:DNA invertase Pin-like site-specific DNA recombinase
VTSQRRRAVLYLRISESDELSTAIERQETDLRRRADRENCDVVAVLIDDGISGGLTRAKADRALAMLRDGEADVLLVWKFDRWSRQGLKALVALMDTLDSRKGTLFIADQDGLTSDQPAWRIIASVLAEVARMEREAISMRVTSSINTLRSIGRFSGGNVPYGYQVMERPDGPGKTLAIEPTEAAVVQDAARRILDGDTLQRVCIDLNARAVPTRRGADWTTTVLRRTVTARAIVGRQVHRGDVLRDEDGIPRTVWPQVLDLDTWHRVRDHLGIDAPAPVTRKRRHARLLSGLARCDVCMHPLYVRQRGGTPYSSYLCVAKSNGRPCPGVAVSCDRLEEHIEAAFLADVGPLPHMIKKVSAPVMSPELADVEAAIRETARQLVEDDADDEALAARLRSLKARRVELRAVIETPEAEFVPSGMTWAQVWADADSGERREILGGVIEAIYVVKGKPGRKGLDASRIDVRWRGTW